MNPGTREHSSEVAWPPPGWGHEEEEGTGVPSSWVIVRAVLLALELGRRLAEVVRPLPGRAGGLVGIAARVLVDRDDLGLGVAVLVEADRPQDALVVAGLGHLVTDL